MLSKEDKAELLKRAREAKAKKRVSVKEEETEDEEETPIINVPMPEPEPEPPTPKKKTGRKPKVPLPVPVEVIQIEEEPLPLPVPKKRVVPNPKWLKQPKTEPEKVCCDAKLTKEEYVIQDEKPQIVKETIVIPSKKEIKKPRQPRASAPTKTLDLTEPKPIEEVLEELSNDAMKYRPPQKKQSLPPVAPVSSAPISIQHLEKPLKLFYY